MEEENGLKTLAKAIMFRYISVAAYIFSLVGLVLEQIWLFGLLFVVALLMFISSSTLELMFVFKTLKKK